MRTTELQIPLVIYFMMKDKQQTGLVALKIRSLNKNIKIF